MKIDRRFFVESLVVRLGIALGAIVLLALVLIPGLGHATSGARRWFKFAGFSFQPSEFLKLAIIFYMADFLERRRGSLSDFKHTVVPALVVLGAVAPGLVLGGDPDPDADCLLLPLDLRLLHVRSPRICAGPDSIA